MRNGNIFSIAAQLGWTASAQYKEGRFFFDFQRKTLSGVPFTFTAEMKDGKVSNLVKEIESFVDAIEPETCASEWMVRSGAVAPSRFRQAVNDMDAIRTEGVAVGLPAGRSGRQIRLGGAALEPVELSSATKQIQRQPSIHEGCS